MKTELYINYHEYHHSHGGYDPDEDYTRDSTSVDRSFEFISLKKKYSKSFDYEYESVNFDISDCKRLYALIVEYNDGDSFGNDTNAHFEVIAIYKDIDKAYLALDQVKLTDSNKITEYEIILENGEKYVSSCLPWQGHFESMYSCEVHALEIIRK